MARSIRDVQELLMAYGYDLGPDGIDGRGGKDTKTAVEKFQLDSRIPVTGQLDHATMELLFPEDYERKASKMNNILGGLFTGLLGNILNWELIKGYLRNALLGFGSSFVTMGLVDQTELNLVVGGVMVVAGVLFSMVSGNTKAKAIAVVKAVDAAPGVTVVPGKSPEVVVTK